MNIFDDISKFVKDIEEQVEDTVESIVEDIADIFDGDFIDNSLTHYTAPLYDNNQATRHQYYQQAILGDNGTPQFFIFKNELILLSVCTFSSANAAAGTSIMYQRDAINSLITDLDFKTGHMTGYQVENVDLDYYFNY